VDDEGLELTGAQQAAIDRLGLEFLAEFYEAALARRPGDLDALADLANVYTQLGRIADGLRLDRELVLRQPEAPDAHYNLACSLALSGDAEAACAALERAIELGYADAEHLLADDDLASLQGSATFERLVARLRTS
jgi:Flp pilus assembly protein TadD